MDEPLARVQTHRRRHDEAGAGAEGQRANVDLELVPPVLAGHEAGHHPRVDGRGPVHHHGEPDPRHGAHGPGAQHLDMGMTAPHQHEIVANFAASLHHGVMTERIMALLLVLSVGLAGCGNGETNFSQEPGFAEYFAKYPPASTPAGPAEQALLRKHRPHFLLPPGHPGMIDFYADYVPEGHLTDGAGQRVAGPLDRRALNAHKGDPLAVFVHEPSGRPGTATVYGRVDQEDVTFETEGGRVVEPFTFLTYHAVFRVSGLPAGMLDWQEWLIGLVASPDDWHQLDHYTAAILALDRGASRWLSSSISTITCAPISSAATSSCPATGAWCWTWPSAPTSSTRISPGAGPIA